MFAEGEPGLLLWLTGRTFKNAGCFSRGRAEAVRGQSMTNLDDLTVAVEKGDIDGIAHSKGVNAFAGGDVQQVKR